MLALFIYFLKTVRQFRQYSSLELASSGRSSTCTRLQTFLSFADEKEQEVKSRQLEMASNRNEVPRDETLNSFQMKVLMLVTKSSDPSQRIVTRWSFLSGQVHLFSVDS